MNKVNLSLGVALVAVVIATGAFFVKTQVQFGANPGPVHTEYQEFDGGVKVGSVNSTTTPASMTLRTSDVYGFDTVIVRPTGAAADKTLTFFASSTASHWLPKAGDTQRTCFLNATTTAAATITFAAGTGIDLQSASSSPTDLTVQADQTACFTFVRKVQVAEVTNSFDIEASFVEFNDAD